MTNNLIKLALLSTLLILSSCMNNINYSKIFLANNSFFEKNRRIFIESKNEIIEKIKTLNKIDLEIKDLSFDTEQKLREIGINEIDIQEIENSTNYRIDFKAFKYWNIDKLRIVKIRYSPNDKKTKKAYHFYDKYHIDIWGQGNDFYIISDTDYF